MAQLVKRASQANALVPMVKSPLARATLLSLFFFQAEDGIRFLYVTGVQTCALPICWRRHYDPGAIAAKQVELLRARQIAHPLDPVFPSADRHGLLFDSGREKSVIRLKPARSIKRMDPLARAAADHAMPTRPLH